jgi:excisionase family DNA binding protein
MKPLLLTTREAAKELGVGRDRCYQLIRTGAIRSVPVGNRRLIPRSELEAWIQRAMEGGEQQHGTAIG